ncbi:hypothetical protein HNQ91_002900 [Filimonas zeae]|uniref:3-phytase n=1 Tax=Filimonas zeae TaxID=1737353 RepID=A0A917IYY4_9BACT|nr:esterase-like activity of phytase family protein [Filimonas zeae]MDR6339835.1 hypothetical protein [Filimonas zeae]GGH69877.1 3-phytase [Filimonas zeae]
MRSFIVYLTLVTATGCAAHRQAAGSASGTTIASLQLLNEYVLPCPRQFNQTAVGGLSGIDYKAATHQYYLICDDRSDSNYARYYTAAIPFNTKGIDSVQLLAVTTLRQPNGRPYPSLKQGGGPTPDPESIRYHPVNKQWFWSSEGERRVKSGDTVLIHPAIYITNAQGQCTDSLELPARFRMQPTEKGTRQNGTLEGLSFADSYRVLFAAMEEPLYEDGPRATPTAGSYTRLLQWDMTTGKCTAQYAYPLEPIAHAPLAAGKFSVNGISEILAINTHELITIERSFTDGVGFTVRLYLVNLEKATNVTAVASLLEDKNFQPVTKKLLLNTESLNRYIDNIEGITWGPVLPNGHRSLVLVSDNNFNKDEKTQFFLFEVLP